MTTSLIIPLLLVASCGGAAPVQPSAALPEGAATRQPQAAARAGGFASPGESPTAPMAATPRLLPTTGSTEVTASPSAPAIVATATELPAVPTSPVPPTETPVPSAIPSATQAPSATMAPAQARASTASSPKPSSSQQAFIQQLVPHAQAEQTDSGVPASFSLALAAAETGWGVSPLMKQYNNYHMIACSKPNEGLPCVRYGNGLWNQYSSPRAAFLWQGRWMRAHSGFAAAFQHTGDVATFVRLVATCYVNCSGPFPQRFYDSTMQIIDQYNLRQYDLPPATPTP